MASPRPRTWRYATARDLGAGALQRLSSLPRRPDALQLLLRSGCALLSRAWLRLYHRVRIHGREHLPNRSCVLVANHQSHLDTFALLAALPLARVHRAFPVAAQDYFFTRVDRAWLAVVMTNALPCPRQGGGRAALRACRAVLRRPGAVVLLFPEGTRSTDGAVGAFRSGVGWLLAGTDVPVVPCHIDGAARAWPKGMRWPRPGCLTVRLGAPRVFANAHKTPAGARGVADALRSAVLALRP